MTEKLELFINEKKRYECQQEKIMHIFVRLNGKAITNITVIKKDNMKGSKID